MWENLNLRKLTICASYFLNPNIKLMIEKSGKVIKMCNSLNNNDLVIMKTEYLFELIEIIIKGDSDETF